MRPVGTNPKIRTRCVGPEGRWNPRKREGRDMSEGELLVVYAAELEGARLRGRARTLQTGVGKVQMTHSLTSAILAKRPAGVLLIGVCGAYPAAHVGGRGRSILDVCLVEVDRLADEGVLAPDRFIPMESLGFPIGGAFLADQPMIEWAQGVLPEAAVVRGATVSSCSGTDAASREIAARTGAMVETMEGAAAALVCGRESVPFLQLRCVSNFTGDRQDAGFRLEDAVERVQDAALALIGSWSMRR